MTSSKHKRGAVLGRRDFCAGVAGFAFVPTDVQAALRPARLRIAERAVAELPQSTVSYLMQAASRGVDSAMDFRTGRTVSVGGVLFSESEIGLWIKDLRNENTR